MAKQNWDVKAFVVGQLAEGKTNLDGARKRMTRLENALQQAFLQLGQDADDLHLLTTTLPGCPQAPGAF